MKCISLIDYGLANMRSVVNAIHYLGVEVEVVTNGKDLGNDNHIILPGVGSFDVGMKGLQDRNFIEPLNELVVHKQIPILGICLGFQLVCQFSEEGNEKGLGWIEEDIVQFERSNQYTVPHIGWNDVIINADSKLYAGMKGPLNFYFVHSYYLPKSDYISQISSGICHYGVEFTASFEKEHIMGCQFHPEKSQLAGLKLLENFLLF